MTLFNDGKIKSVPDYVLGIEVGLDSNARKNRSGTSMDSIVEHLIKVVCQKNNFSLKAQVRPKTITDEWGQLMQPDKANRIFDYAIKYDDQIYLLEISYYGGGGSKLKATAGEYKTLYDFLSKQGFKFIWITDGLGWKTTTRALQETFNHVDHVINLKMLTDGILEGIVLNKL